MRSLIANTSRPEVLAGEVTVTPVNTKKEAHERTVSERKQWIAFAAEVMGALHVDAGAERALTERPNSLLPAGTLGVDGAFVVGDTVDIVGPSGRPFARGLAAVDADVVRSVLGRRTGDLPPGVNHEVVHRDDLVVLPS
jgi:glutamate 5-kinase